LKISDLFKSTGFLLLLAYLAFIPTGPFPISVVDGLNLDVAIGLLLYANVIVFSYQIKHYPNVLIGSWLIYFLVVFISAILSVNFEASFKNALIMFGYSQVTLLVPVIFMNRGSAIRKWLFIVAIVAAVLILYLYMFLGFGHDYRFYLSTANIARPIARELGFATVDPNMTAAGLLLALIVYFPNLFDDRKHLILDLLGPICILAASLILLSRSAILGFILSVIFSFLIVLLKSLISRKAIVLKRLILISYSVVFVAVSYIILLVLGDIMLPDIIGNVEIRIAQSANDSIRINLLISAWNVFMTDTKTVVIGAGFMTTNPHNEYMRILSAMGLLGVVSSIFFLGFMVYISIKELSHNYRLYFHFL